MTSSKWAFFLLLVLAVSACNGGGGGAASTTATLTGITVIPQNPSISLNSSQQFHATGTYSDNSTQDLTATVTWSSSNTSVAIVSNAAGSNGLATSVGNGSTTVMAVSAGITGSTILSVTTATLVSIAILPANPTASVGITVAFSAIGSFSDGSTQDLTKTATWSSSNTSVASISNAVGSNGTATPSAAGAPTITATVGSIKSTTILTVTGVGGGQVNVLPITVNGSLCSSATSADYFNKPCVSVTVCNPDGSNCQVINDILLDTGSYGLRIFQSALGNLSLTQVAAGSGSLTECVEYAGAAANWGPVQMATVILGGEPAIQVPIQVIDSSFGNPNSRLCPGAAITPKDAGFTGILGVGLFTQDCGADCANNTNNGNYYACNGSTCIGTQVPLNNQVTNPVALLPVDKNGVLVQLPVVPLGGLSSVNGSLILGIGTQSNNAPGSATAYPASGSAARAPADFTTSFQGVSSASSFIDSGSNALYFAAPTTLLPQDSTGFFIPPVAVGSSLAFSATISGDLGPPPSGTVLFQIGNFDSLVNTNNNVFSEVGGYQTGGFDWGLPFFFGRNVFVGFEGMSSPLGSGPYWGY